MWTFHPLISTKVTVFSARMQLYARMGFIWPGNSQNVVSYIHSPDYNVERISLYTFMLPSSPRQRFAPSRFRKRSCVHFLVMKSAVYWGSFLVTFWTMFRWLYGEAPRMEHLSRVSFSELSSWARAIVCPASQNMTFRFQFDRVHRTIRASDGSCLLLISFESPFEDSTVHYVIQARSIT